MSFACQIMETRKNQILYLRSKYLMINDGWLIILQRSMCKFIATNKRAIQRDLGQSSKFRRLYNRIVRQPAIGSDFAADLLSLFHIILVKFVIQKSVIIPWKKLSCIWR